jgi:Trp operon repressor
MEYLISNREICNSMGKESAKIARGKYDVKIVNHSIMQVMGL